MPKKMPVLTDNFRLRNLERGECQKGFANMQRQLSGGRSGRNEQPRIERMRVRE